MAFSGLISAHTLINSHISYFEIQRIHAKANSYRGSSNSGLSLVVRNTDIEGVNIARLNHNRAEQCSVVHFSILHNGTRHNLGAHLPEKKQHFTSLAFLADDHLVSSSLRPLQRFKRKHRHLDQGSQFSVSAVGDSLRDGILLAIQGYENTCPNVYQARSNRNVTNHCNHKHLQPILSRFLTRPLYGVPLALQSTRVQGRSLDCEKRHQC